MSRIRQKTYSQKLINFHSSKKFSHNGRLKNLIKVFNHHAPPTSINRDIRKVEMNPSELWVKCFGYVSNLIRNSSNTKDSREKDIWKIALLT